MIQNNSGSHNDRRYLCAINPSSTAVPASAPVPGTSCTHPRTQRDGLSARRQEKRRLRGISTGAQERGRGTV